ncbi:MAG: endonuclease/exonuclease/phosphatase family protein [Phycisphaerales bacterium]
MPTIIALRSRLLLFQLIMICTAAITQSTSSAAPSTPTTPTALRIATFNIEDVRSEDLDTPDTPRLQHIAEILQRMRPNIVLLAELAQRQDETTTNADLFVKNYLSIPQAPGLKPIRFNTYTPNSNTGMHTGIDLDHSGTIAQTPPEPSDHQTPEARQYANDCFGFGTFKGQYALALLVDPKLTIDTNHIRTFQHFLWKDLPAPHIPTNPDGSPYYTPQAWDIFRLSSKTFADIPITLPSGSTLHALISHPTPPAFDGPEQRNKCRNHDEIKLLRLYIDNDPALTDDQGQSGGLPENASFVILGDLNADPTDGSSLDMVILTQLLTSPKLAKDVFPSSPIKISGLDPTDTSSFKLRVDYVLPSADITITNAAIWRDPGSADAFPSDHFPVWIEAIIP